MSSHFNPDVHNGMTFAEFTAVVQKYVDSEMAARSQSIRQST